MYSVTRNLGYSIFQNSTPYAFLQHGVTNRYMYIKAAVYP